MREVKITFDEVKNFIKDNTKYSIDEMIDAVEPFTMDYIKSPFGFAETDNLNDIQKCLDEIYLHFVGIMAEPDGRVRRGYINRTIKRENERWKQGNAAGFGRMVGRLGYLLNQNKK